MYMFFESLNLIQVFPYFHHLLADLIIRFSSHLESEILEREFKPMSQRKLILPEAGSQARSLGR